MIDRGIIVSCQPNKSGYFYGDAWKFAAEVEDYAVAVRMEGFENVKRAASVVDIPVIGLVKRTVVTGKESLRHSVWITPEVEDADDLKTNGADYIATDATGRFGISSVPQMVKAGHNVIADIATIEQALRAEVFGCCAVTTALAGYTDDYWCKSPFEGPDIKLVELCAKMLKIPVIAEGRYHTVKMVSQAFEAGAHSVCIGAAITLPKFITQHFTIPFEQTVNGKGKKFYLEEWKYDDKA